ncbi:hypothetical protein QYM36_014792 [Artemia franciscana]|uniref:Uncharacterized protein n=1 Tax=Artemia franciscana TaxID=6661 RepID=A0AA88KU05_ARTSF|nr:hypothetical protein QYM36_014792 [Artemia franciscana]
MNGRQIKSNVTDCRVEGKNNDQIHGQMTLAKDTAINRVLQNVGKLKGSRISTCTNLRLAMKAVCTEYLVKGRQIKSNVTDCRVEGKNNDQIHGQMTLAKDSAINRVLQNVGKLKGSRISTCTNLRLAMKAVCTEYLVKGRQIKSLGIIMARV